MLRCKSRSKGRAITFIADGSHKYNTKSPDDSESNQALGSYSPTLLPPEIAALKPILANTIKFLEKTNDPLLLFNNQILFAHLSIGISDIPSHRRGYFNYSALYGSYIKIATIMLSRDLPPSPTYKLRVMDPHLDLFVHYPYFNNLKIIYELLVKFFSAPDLKRSELEFYIDNSFLRLLFSLFDSSDPRELDYLVQVLQKLYTQCVNRREMIRLFVICKLRLIADGSRPISSVNGLLDLVSNIIKASGVNISNTQDNIYTAGVLPLLKAPHFSYFASSYSSIIFTFIMKSDYFALLTIKKLLSQWPLTSSEREIYHLDILSLILNCLNMMNLDSNLVSSIVLRLANSALSPHYQVAEISLSIMSSEAGIHLLSDDSQRNLVAAINAAKIAATHWHNEVKHGANQFLLKLYRIDSNAFKAAELLSDAMMDLLTDESVVNIALDTPVKENDKNTFRVNRKQYMSLLTAKYESPDIPRTLGDFKRRKSVTLKISHIDEIGSITPHFAPQE